MAERTLQSPEIDGNFLDGPLNLEENWHLSEGLTQQEIATLFRRADFVERVTDCLNKTRFAELPSDHPDMPYQQEFGFVGFRAPWSKDTHIYLSPIFAGTERNIDLDRQARDWQSAHPEIPSSQILSLHTHPYHGDIKLLETLKRVKRPVIRRFSKGDLEYYHQVCLNEGAGVINAVALQSGRQAEIIATSFRDFESYKRFDPDKIESEFLRKLTTDEDPLTAYTDAGLNLAVLRINLQAGQINQRDIIKASKILSQVTGRMAR